MEFITENYIWFIIIGIFILMVIIGFIADKTDFTKKEENKEKVKKQKKNKKEKVQEVSKEEVTEPVEDLKNETAEFAFNSDEPINEQETLENVESTNELTSIEPTDELTSVEPTLETEVQPSEEVIAEPVESTEDSTLNVENSEIQNDTIEQNMFNEELNDEKVDLESNNELVESEMEPKEEVTEPEEDLYVGLDGTPNAFKQDENKEENLEIELPSISSLDDELKEDNDEDDVWKF